MKHSIGPSFAQEYLHFRCVFADDAADDADDETDDDAVNTKIPIMDTISPTIIDIQHSLRMSSQRPVSAGY